MSGEPGRQDTAPDQLRHAAERACCSPATLEVCCEPHSRPECCGGRGKSEREAPASCACAQRQAPEIIAVPLETL